MTAIYDWLMQMTSKLFRLAALAIALVALAGCKDIITGKDYTPEKGVYPGAEVKKLSDEQTEALRQRTHIQRGGGI